MPFTWEETVRNLLVGLLLWPASIAWTQERSQKLTLMQHWNQRASAQYNDIWGYTGPDGSEYALLGVRDGTSVIALDTDDGQPQEVAFIPSPNSVWKDIKTFKHYAYVVNESGGGLQIIDLSQLPHTAQLVAVYNDFYTSHNLYIDEDRGILYAEGNHIQPVRLLSLENPTAPVQRSTFGVECHDIYARGDYVYVSEGGHGTIGIFDTSDPDKIELAARFQIPNAGYVHNAWLNEAGTILMTTEETTGKTIKLWDVEDFANVTMLGEYLAPNRLAHNTHLKDGFAFISHYGGGLRIVDISNPRHPTEVGYYTKSDETPGGFVHAWGAFPFFASNRVLMSDIESGLYVVEFSTEGS